MLQLTRLGLCAVAFAMAHAPLLPAQATPSGMPVQRASAAADFASVQPTKQPQKSKSPPKPEASDHKPGETDVLSLLKPTGKRKAWILKVDLVISAAQGEKNAFGNSVDAPIEFDEANLYFPHLLKSKSHEARAPGTDPTDGYLTTLTIGEDTIHDAGPRDVVAGGGGGGAGGGGGKGGAWYAEWTLRAVKSMQMKLQVQLPVTCWETTFDAAAAEKLGWPRTWSPLAASTFTDKQACASGIFLIDHEHESVKHLLAEWCKGKDPKQLPPVVLAKHLAGSVLEYVQPSGQGQRSRGPDGNYPPDKQHWGVPVAFFAGLSLQRVDQTIRSRRGSEHDINCLLTAIYRAAGLPARVVIGVETRDSYQEGQPLRQRVTTALPLRSWVEFCLADETSQAEIWIPVDVVRQRAKGSRVQSNNPGWWKYFGDNPDLDDVIPLTHHFTPPFAGAESSNFAIWGWATKPKWVNHNTSISLSTRKPSERGK